MRSVTGTHVGFLRHIKRKRARQLAYGEWETPSPEEVLWEAGMQLEAK